MLVLSAQIINIKAVNESYSKDYILNKTPILSSLSANIVTTFTEIWELRNSEEKENLDQQIYEILENNEFITRENIMKLIEAGKIKSESIEEEE
jgi:hypothetical protein